MTRKQMELEQKAIRKARQEKSLPVSELNRRATIISCVDMIDSIICYHCYGMTAEQVMEYEETAYHNYLEDYVKELGKNVVLELIQGQIDCIVEIRMNVFTDDEGLSYNTLIYNDEN